MIAIIDYGIGNVKSVANMLRKTGQVSQVTDDPLILEQADKIILPGVGAFDAGIERLKRARLFNTLCKRVLDEKIPLLGICLGMQLLAKSSEEGSSPGLGWVDAEVVRFEFPPSGNDLKIPHMGWNLVDSAHQNELFRDIPEPMRFYFVHSYHIISHDKQAALATAEYGYEFVCAIARENIMGVQFHPEKSHKYGMQLLKNFAEYC